MDADRSIEGEPPLSEWAELLESACSALPRLGIRQIRVLRETASTQDAAWRAGGGSPGWLVIAGRQTAGRGRLGRSWVDTGGAGLALTLALPRGLVSPIGVGLAVCRAANSMLPSALLGLRWPNDVVERSGIQRKAAGVLIEARNHISLVGIGVNVGPMAWPPDLEARAVCLHELGSSCTRPSLALAVLANLDRVLDWSGEQIATEAAALDTLKGTLRRFVYDGQNYEGVVESIEADSSIRVRTDEGALIELPALATSLLHD
ncbi:MAG: biotin--[acetyl-CoA-carboxylase] ligase [Phycisphaerales bacterium]|nr:biotin--[acetyl-CoA-carboxylase] ligase [Phycisphaerales bacterium]